MKRIKLTYRGKEIISDIFSMKAFRVMYDALSGEITAAVLDDAAMQGLIAMFDGTGLTGDILVRGWEELDAGELDDALKKVTTWYTSIIYPDIPQTAGEIPENPILALYNSFLPEQLPSEVDKQDPQLLLDVRHAKISGTASADDIPDDMKVFYGL